MLSKRYRSVPPQMPSASAGLERNTVQWKPKRENGKYIFSQGVILMWKTFLPTSKENKILMEKKMGKDYEKKEKFAKGYTQWPEEEEKIAIFTSNQRQWKLKSNTYIYCSSNQHRSFQRSYAGQGNKKLLSFWHTIGQHVLEFLKGWKNFLKEKPWITCIRIVWVLTKNAGYPAPLGPMGSEPSEGRGWWICGL